MPDDIVLLAKHPLSPETGGMRAQIIDVDGAPLASREKDKRVVLRAFRCAAYNFEK